MSDLLHSASTSWRVLLAATPLIALAWASVEMRSWIIGVLFGALLALYLVAGAQWLAARRFRRFPR